MAPHKRQVFAIVIFVVVFGAAVLSFALTEIASNQAAPILPVPAPSPTQSPANQNPTATNPPSTAPTETPTSTPPPAPLQATSVNGSFELTISVEKTVYSLGEPVNITLSITNISKQTVNFTHTGMDFDFLVTNDTDNLVYQWSIGRAFPMFAMIEPLQPGENVTATYTWPQTCNANTSTARTPVSAGTYYIVGKSNPIYGLQTAPVQIMIVGS
jgi:hypothetical protein